jgi:hypothetical protein
MSHRDQLLHTIISDAASSVAEKEAAQRQLNIRTGHKVSQDLQDSELEQYLSPNPNLRSSDLVATRQQFSPSSQQLLDDIGACVLVMPPADGAMERLTNLAETTHSAIVRERVTAAIKTIAYLNQKAT